MRHGRKRAAAPGGSGVRQQKRTQCPQSRHPQSCIGCQTLSREIQGWKMCPTAGRWPPSHLPLQYLRVRVGRCVRFLGCKGWCTGLFQEGDSRPQVPVRCPSGVFVPPLKALFPFLFAPETLISSTCRPRPLSLTGVSSNKSWHPSPASGLLLRGPTTTCPLEASPQDRKSTRLNSSH